VLKHEIVERLKPLNPDKVILFGSYAYGTPNEDSDIDLFLVNNTINDTRYEAKALMNLEDLIYKYHIGFDVLSSSSSFLENREDHFYKEDILNKGRVIYGK
jgi:predicted nucleotidyltransferase